MACALARHPKLANPLPQSSPGRGNWLVFHASHGTPVESRKLKIAEAGPDRRICQRDTACARQHNLGHKLDLHVDGGGRIQPSQLASQVGRRNVRSGSVQLWLSLLSVRNRDELEWALFERNVAARTCSLKRFVFAGQVDLELDFKTVPAQRTGEWQRGKERRRGQFSAHWSLRFFQIQRCAAVEPIPPLRPMTIEAADQSEIRKAAHRKNFLCLRAAALG